MNIDEHLRRLNDCQTESASFLHITAYENRMSNTASQFLSSNLSERYYFGGGDDKGIINWNPFTVKGMPAVESIEKDAERAVKSMLGASVVNLRCLSGVHAMSCAIMAATEVGDVVMVLHRDDGGHFSTPVILERTGRKVIYAVFDAESLLFDITETVNRFKESGGKALYLDISYPIAEVNLSELRAALGSSATIIYDASHTMGLILGGVFQNPFKYGVDVICANTHKTLPGPHKGMVVFRDMDTGDRMNGMISNGFFSTSHVHHLIALSVTLLEMEAYGNAYSKQIIKNSNALGAALARLGYEVRQSPDGIYSHTHQVHVFLPEVDNIAVLYKRFIDNSISTNFDNRLGGRLFARFGTQELTRRGMKECDMERLAVIIHSALKGNNVLEEVKRLNGEFPFVFYSFDRRNEV